MDNPGYFEKCLKNMFDMVIECNSRMRVQDFDTSAADEQYKATKPGDSYVEARTNEERAWRQLCRVHGNTKPKTDFDRLEFLLALVAAYHNDHRPAAVNAATTEKTRFTGMGAGAVETCAICEKPGHNARDCLVFMQREGVCGHWFMHHIGTYKSGCNFGDSCRKKHERPSREPAENSKGAAPNATQVEVMAAKTIPETHGATPVLKEVRASDVTDQKFILIPNNAETWMCCNKVWLQPKDDATSMCTHCQEGHSIVKPCKTGGRHSGMLHQMAQPGDEHLND